MNIAVLGRFSPPVLACIRSWGRNGHRVSLICPGSENTMKPACRYLDGFYTLPSSLLYKEAGIQVVSSFLDDCNADALSCIEDRTACWLSENADAFRNSISFVFPSSKDVTAVLSKARQNMTAKQAGLTVLPDYLIDNNNIFNLNINPEHFPLCLRPSEPDHVSPYFKVRLVNSEAELKQFLNGITLKEKGQIIAQPFKNLPNLVVHGIRCTSGTVKYLSAFIVKRKFEGVTLTLEPYSQISLPLKEGCKKFVNYLGVTGNFHFEFLFDPETRKSFFLEINLRFGGTTAKVLACGYDEPMYALEAYGIAEKSFEPALQKKIVSNKQALLKYMAKAVCGRLGLLDYPDEPVAGKLRAGIKGLLLFYDEVLGYDDFQGSLNLYLNNIIHKFRRNL